MGSVYPGWAHVAQLGGGDNDISKVLTGSKDVSRLGNDAPHDDVHLDRCDLLVGCEHLTLQHKRHTHLEVILTASAPVNLAEVLD